MRTVAVETQQRQRGGARLCIVLPWGLSALAACTPISTGFQSANSYERARAAVHAADDRDTAALASLVGLLQDPDAGVRFYAIESLRRLTGRDHGYRYYDTEAERDVAVRAWQAEVRQTSPSGAASAASMEP